MTIKLANRMQGITSFYVMELLQRAKQLEKQGRDIVHMEIGEPDFSTPPQIVAAGIDYINQGNVKYTPAAGLPELREKIAGFYRQRYRQDIVKERIFITPGASGAFLLAMGVSLNPGEEILLADPCYPCNSNFIKLFGGIARLVAVNGTTDYQLTAGLIKQHWNENTKGALIASPSNPTGTIISPEQMQQAIDFVNSHNGCFYSDEIYHGLVYGKDTETALQFSDEVFVINSFSKFFGMTGWRVGWLVVPEAFIDAVDKLAQNIFISSPSHSQYAALAAFDENTLAVLESRRLEFATRRDFLYQRLKKIGFEIAVKPEGAFYIYADCSRFTKDSFQFALQLLEVEGVAITPGKDFGDNKAAEYVRFAYTMSQDKLEEGARRIEQFINRNEVS